MESEEFRKKLLLNQNEKIRKSISENQEYINLLIKDNEKLIVNYNENIIEINKINKNLINKPD